MRPHGLVEVLEEEVDVVDVFRPLDQVSKVAGQFLGMKYGPRVFLDAGGGSVIEGPLSF